MNTFSKVAFLAIAVMLAPIARTHGASGDLDSPSVALPASLVQADREKIHAALKRKDCTFISGSNLNKESQLHYKSDTESLGKFLEALSKCSGVKIHIGFYKPGPDAMWAVADSNWSVFHSATDNRFSVKIRLESDIDLATLHIPALTTTRVKKADADGIGVENSGLELANSGLQIARFGALGGGLPGDHTFQQPTFEPVKWQKPEGAPPAWLTSAKNSTEAVERLRTLLSGSTKVNLDDSPLAQVLHKILDPKEIQVDINVAKLEEYGLDPEERVSLKGEGSLRDILRRLLESRELAYIVHESCIEITTADDAQARPTMRCYDLSFVQPDSSHVQEVLDSIEGSIYPDLWVNNGGVCDLYMVGSVLVASTTEPAHHRIEALLHKLSQAIPDNLPKPAVSTIPTPSLPR